MKPIRPTPKLPTRRRYVSVEALLRGEKVNRRVRRRYYQLKKQML